jgi:hypothetical protein
LQIALTAAIVFELEDPIPSSEFCNSMVSHWLKGIEENLCKLFYRESCDGDKVGVLRRICMFLFSTKEAVVRCKLAGTRTRKRSCITWIKGFLAFQISVASALEPLLSLTIHELARANSLSNAGEGPDQLGPGLCWLLTCCVLSLQVLALQEGNEELESALVRLLHQRTGTYFAGLLSDLLICLQSSGFFDNFFRF